MKKQVKLLAIIFVVLSLCGCDTTFGMGRLEDPMNEMYTEIDYYAVKEGYYLSDSGDGSYYLIKDGKLTHANYDWEKKFRERNPISEHSDMTPSEYEEYVSECVVYEIKNHTDKPFTPIKYINYPEGFPYIVLVIDPSPEEINSNGYSGGSGPHMKDENTIGTSPPFYVYCGTSLPESE